MNRVTESTITGAAHTTKSTSKYAGDLANSQYQPCMRACGQAVDTRLGRQPQQPQPGGFVHNSACFIQQIYYTRKQILTQKSIIMHTNNVHMY